MAMVQVTAEQVQQWFNENRTAEVRSTDLLPILAPIIGRHQSRISIKSIQRCLVVGYETGWLMRKRSTIDGSVIYRLRDPQRDPAHPAPVAPKVAPRPTLPEFPTRTELTTAVNAMQAWIAEVKTYTRQQAIKIMRHKGTCSRANQYLIDAQLPPLEGVSRGTVNLNAESRRVIEPSAPILEAHYTNEGLDFIWQQLNQEADQWLATARRVTLQRVNDHTITESTMNIWLAQIHQPKLAKKWFMSVTITADWTCETEPSTDQRVSEATAALRAWAEGQNLEVHVAGSGSSSHRVV